MRQYLKKIFFIVSFFLFAPFLKAGAEVRSFIPNDPLFKEQPYLNAISAPQAWGYITDAQDVIIAVIDSGVDINHEDLRNNIWTNKDEDPFNRLDDDGNGYIDDAHGWNFIENNNDPRPVFEEGFNFEGIAHGTLVSGIIAAEGNNLLGVSGIAHKAEIMPLRALNSAGKGNTTNVARAILYAVENGADVINLSFVGSEFDPILEKVIKIAYESGAVIVAAVGNEDGGGVSHNDLNEKPLYPVCYEKGENYIIGVGSVEFGGKKNSFSNFGSRCIDINAYGARIVSTQVFQESSTDSRFHAFYSGYWSGTSFSAPMVSGAAAIVRALNPLFNNNQIIAALLDGAESVDSANPGLEGKLGRGSLNMVNAVVSSAPIGYTKGSALTLSFSRRPMSVIAANRSGAPPFVGVFTEKVLTSSIMPYKGLPNPPGLRVSQGDVDGDSELDIVIAPRGKAAGDVHVYGQNGNFKHSFPAFSEKFREGLNIHAANVFRGLDNEIIIASASGESKEVRIFTGIGDRVFKITPFSSIAKGGIAVSSINFDNRGEREILVGAYIRKDIYQIKIFDADGALKKEKKFSGLDGFVEIASGDVLGDANEEAVISYVKNKQAQVIIADRNLIVVSQWIAFNRYALLSAPVSIVYNRPKKGRGKIVFGVDVGAKPKVKFFDGKGRERGFFWFGNRDSLEGVDVG